MAFMAIIQGSGLVFLHTFGVQAGYRNLFLSLDCKPRDVGRKVKGQFSIDGCRPWVRHIEKCTIRFGDFPKITGTFLGVSIIRTRVL